MYAASMSKKKEPCQTHQHSGFCHSYTTYCNSRVLESGPVPVLSCPWCWPSRLPEWSRPSDRLQPAATPSAPGWPLNQTCTQSALANNNNHHHSRRKSHRRGRRRRRLRRCPRRVRRLEGEQKKQAQRRGVAVVVAAAAVAVAVQPHPSSASRRCKIAPPCRPSGPTAGATTGFLRVRRLLLLRVEVFDRPRVSGCCP